jgi:hypothetical protein
MPPCDPRRGVVCSSHVRIVQEHFFFCQRLCDPRRRTLRDRPTRKAKPLALLPLRARSVGDVIAILVAAGLNQRQAALLFLDHERRGRRNDVPLTRKAIEDRHKALRSARSYHATNGRRKAT